MLELQAQKKSSLKRRHALCLSSPVDCSINVNFWICFWHNENRFWWLYVCILCPMEKTQSQLLSSIGYSLFCTATVIPHTNAFLERSLRCLLCACTHWKNGFETFERHSDQVLEWWSSWNIGQKRCQNHTKLTLWWSSGGWWAHICD